MFKNYATRFFAARSMILACKFSTPATTTIQKPIEIIDTRSLPGDDFVDIKIEKTSALDKCVEDVSHVAPYLQPSFNFAAYINKSETLQQLLKLGVDLHKVEQKPDAVPFILGLDFEKHIKNHVLFLSDVGLNSEEIAAFVSKNPMIFKEDLDDLQVRINYLKCKKFTAENILRLISSNPFWLMFSTQRIDEKLGFFQKGFSLSGNEVRQLAVQQPKLITCNIKNVKLNMFCVKEEMGFTPEETKEILLLKPKIFMKNRKNLLKTFDYIHNVMKIPLEVIAKVPQVLTCREFRVKQRHLFLKALGKAQYDPKKENYVSILTLVSDEDGDFCVNTAKSSLQAYNTFLKSL